MQLSYLACFVFLSARIQSGWLSAPKPPGRGEWVLGGLKAFVGTDRDKTEGMRGQARAVVTDGPSLRERKGEWGNVGVAGQFKKGHLEQEFLLFSPPWSHCSKSSSGLPFLIVELFSAMCHILYLLHYKIFSKAKTAVVILCIQIYRFIRLISTTLASLYQPPQHVKELYCIIDPYQMQLCDSFHHNATTSSCNHVGWACLCALLSDNSFLENVQTQWSNDYIILSMLMQQTIMC